MATHLFTSESVSEGHPDKVADQISDAVRDAIIAQDKRARVACESLVTTGMAMIAGEITTTAWVDMPNIVRQTIREIGYNSSEMGFDWQSCAVLTSIGKQSPDIAQGVDEGKGIDLDQGAGDQGLMFGYACTETRVLMPMPITSAHRLMKRLFEVRKAGRLPWLRRDAKSQVTIEYQDKKPKRIEAVVLSTQHSPDIDYNDLKEGVMEEIIKPDPPKILRMSAADLETHTVKVLSDNEPGERNVVSCGNPGYGHRIIAVDPVNAHPVQSRPDWRAVGTWSQCARRILGTAGGIPATFEGRLAETDEGPFLRTGDLGLVADGEVYVTGRLKDMIIVAGRNHYPGDIELTVQQSGAPVRMGACAAVSEHVNGVEELIIIVEVDERRLPAGAQSGEPGSESLKDFWASAVKSSLSARTRSTRSPCRA